MLLWYMFSQLDGEILIAKIDRFKDGQFRQGNGDLPPESLRWELGATIKSNAVDGDFGGEVGVALSALFIRRFHELQQ